MKTHVAVAVITAVLVWWVMGLRWDADVDRIERAHAEQMTQQANAANENMAAQVKEHERQVVEIEQGIKDANEKSENALMDANSARSVAERLRKERDRLLAESRNRSASASQGSQTSDDLAALFADLFSRADQRAGELAEYGDQARIAGLTCERIYDGVRGK